MKQLVLIHQNIGANTSKYKHVTLVHKQLPFLLVQPRISLKLCLIVFQNTVFHGDQFLPVSLQHGHWILVLTIGHFNTWLCLANKLCSAQSPTGVISTLAKGYLIQVANAQVSVSSN